MNMHFEVIGNKTAIASFSENHLDAGNVKQFRDQTHAVLDDTDMLLIDMSKLSFVDSSGLGALLSCLRILNRNNGQMRLFGLTKPVTALLELVRMHRLFAIYDDREAALRSVTHNASLVTQ